MHSQRVNYIHQFLPTESPKHVDWNTLHSIGLPHPTEHPQAHQQRIQESRHRGEPILTDNQIADMMKHDTDHTFPGIGMHRGRHGELVGITPAVRVGYGVDTAGEYFPRTAHPFDVGQMGVQPQLPSPVPIAQPLESSISNAPTELEDLINFHRGIPPSKLASFKGPQSPYGQVR